MCRRKMTLFRTQSLRLVGQSTGLRAESLLEVRQLPLNCLRHVSQILSGANTCIESRKTTYIRAEIDFRLQRLSRAVLADARIGPKVLLTCNTAVQSQQRTRSIMGLLSSIRDGDLNE